MLHCLSASAYSEEFEYFYRENRGKILQHKNSSQRDLLVAFQSGRNEVMPTLVANVSGADHNCLLRCFGLFNPNLRDRGEPRSRQDYMDYLQIKARRVPEFASYIEKGFSADADSVVQSMTSADAYLDYLFDPMHMIPYGSFDLDGDPAGLSIALAYISNVNLRVYTVAGGTNTEVLSWDHPDEEVSGNPARTLRIIHGRAHYQLMSLSISREITAQYSAYAKHNAWITWQRDKARDAESEAYIRKMREEGIF